jgi:nickel transport system ATP-binding protein
MVFQDAISAVNPRKTVREILREPMRHMLSLTKAEQLARASDMLRAVDLDDSVLISAPAAERRTAAARLPGARAGG